eukprot:scaffold67589_cov15-Prasinocladus_malaysianus.AAC.2
MGCIGGCAQLHLHVEKQAHIQSLTPNPIGGLQPRWPHMVGPKPPKDGHEGCIDARWLKIRPV